MKEIISREKCCGCTACASICAKNAIVMNMGEDGFKYPVISEELCVDCGRCVSVCPINNILQNPQGKSYALKHVDKNILENSTSGGFFTAVSDYYLENDGVVYGAILDDNLVCRHVRADNIDERNKMRGSKYVESDLANNFSMIKEDLTQNKKVLFVGTPCQTNGLKNYLKGKDDNLLCIDLICHGVPSPLVFSEHIKYLNKKARKKLVDYKFRSKKWSWHVHREMAILENGKEWHSNFHTDAWRAIYYGKLAVRNSCHNCNYTNLTRPGDITIGDCRGVDKVYSDMDSREGVSLVFVNTPKGEEVFDKIRDNLQVREIDVDKVMQPTLKTRIKPNPRRERFIKLCYDGEYKKALTLAFGKHYILKYNIKKFLNRP